MIPVTKVVPRSGNLHISNMADVRNPHYGCHILVTIKPIFSLYSSITNACDNYEEE